MSAQHIADVHVTRTTGSRSRVQLVVSVELTGLSEQQAERVRLRLERAGERIASAVARVVRAVEVGA